MTLRDAVKAHDWARAQAIVSGRCLDYGRHPGSMCPDGPEDVDLELCPACGHPLADPDWPDEHELCAAARWGTY
jgi:hypothetical protein